MRDIFQGLKTDLGWIFKAVIDSARTRTRLPARRRWHPEA
jgi:hypothetical protein